MMAAARGNFRKLMKKLKVSLVLILNNFEIKTIQILNRFRQVI